MSDTNERPQRVLELAKGLVDAAHALEDEQWDRLERIARDCSRQARVLSLIDREEKIDADANRR